MTKLPARPPETPPGRPPRPAASGSAGAPPGTPPGNLTQESTLLLILSTNSQNNLVEKKKLQFTDSGCELVI